MKHTALIIVFVVNSMCLFAQDKPDLNSVYHFIQPTQLFQCDNLGVPIENKSQVFPADLEFEITGITLKGKGDIIIDIIYFREDIPNTAQANKDLNLKYRGTEDKFHPVFYYLIPSTVFNTVSEKEQSPWSISFGTASTLLKYRPGSSKLFQNKYPINSDIGNDFSLAALVGVQLSVNKSVNEYFLFGIDYTSIKMTAQTTQGVLTSDTNVGALTPTLAYVFEYNKVQLGLFSGLDMPTGAAGKSWVYKGRPWFGIGIGFSIFKPGSSSTGAKQTAPSTPDGNK